MATKDMRRADFIIPYVPPTEEEEAGSGDVMSTVASSLPIMAMFSRNKFVGWTSVVVTLQNWLAETPKSRAKAKQPAIFSLLMSVLGLGVAYMYLFTPPPPGMMNATRTGAPAASPEAAP